MTREEFYKTERNTHLYETCPTDQEIQVPVTRDEFESLLKRASEVNELFIDDGLRCGLAGYIHHIPPDQDTLTINKVAMMLMKRVSNNISSDIDQESKMRIQKKIIDEANKVKDNVTEIKRSDSLSEL